MKIILTIILLFATSCASLENSNTDDLTSPHIEYEPNGSRVR